MEKRILEKLTSVWAGRELYCYDETGSTNDDVKKLLEDGARHGVLVLADAQTAGKGRRGRSWVAEPGQTIAMSLGIRPDFSVEKASMLTLVMALAVREAILHVTGLSCEIKWPNDIVYEGKKLCGILTQLCLDKDGAYSVIIGVGINVNVKVFPQEISDIATSLYLEKQQETDRASLVAECMKQFEAYYARFVLKEDLSELQKEYNDCLVNLDTKVKVLDPAGEYDGVARGIDESGQLLVETADGIKAVYAGEVSVRGVYGYV